MAVGIMSIIVASALAAGPAPVPESAAEAVLFRDGSVLLGQVVEPAPRGTLLVLTRRAWAEEKLPDRAKRWEKDQETLARRAVTQRRERLTSWQRDRMATAGADAPILAWIERELRRLSDPAGPPRSKLMAVRISRGEVRTVVRRTKAQVRMLRQAWLMGFNGVESMSLRKLQDALEGRGFLVGDGAAIAVDRLLPVPSETEAHWLARRGATEVANDPGLKFLRAGAAIFPEPIPGQPPALGDLASAVGELKGLIEGKPADPLGDTLRGVGARARVGAVVTGLMLSPDLSTVRVETTLWVRLRDERWIPAFSRSSVARPDDLPANAGEPLAEDPQVKAVFNVVESLGLGNISDDVKRRSLNVGAASRKALGAARSALQEEIEALAFPVHEPVDEAGDAAKP